MSTVTTNPFWLGDGPVLVQNLGPDELYVGSPTVSATTGIKLTSGQAVSLGFSSLGFVAVSAGTSDVRLLDDATGISPAPSA